MYDTSSSVSCGWAGALGRYETGWERDGEDEPHDERLLLPDDHEDLLLLPDDDEPLLRLLLELEKLDPPPGRASAAAATRPSNSAGPSQRLTRAPRRAIR
jgi:hypothetical protein